MLSVLSRRKLEHNDSPHVSFTIDVLYDDLITAFCLLFGSLQNFPPEMLSCVLVLEQALSVRALQEMVTAANSDTVLSNFLHPPIL